MRLVLVAVCVAVPLLVHASIVVADHPKKSAAKSTTGKNPDGRQAPLLDNLGDHRRPVSTKHAQAQRYFNQGLILAYGFNHAEAERAFREAARLDPECAIAWWGVALVLGPNINASMQEDAVPKAHEAIQRAVALKSHASPVEVALIDALAQRYTDAPVEDRSELNEAYAEAMRKVVEQYPDDLDAVTLLAEALMDLHPWDYWKRSGEAQPWTGEFVTLLESVLERDPKHPGANHYYIHAVEASSNPDLATPAADRLGTLVPGAGHLVHMPSHIYIRTGRYADARKANELAIEADDQYVTQCHAQGLYPLAYMSHNHHFLSAAAAMEGRSRQALDAARHMAQKQDHDMMRTEGFGTLQHYAHWPLFVLVRFGHWEEILREPRPADDLLYPTGIWHYARGMALTRQNKLHDAQRELESLAKLAANPQLESLTIWDVNSTAAILHIATKVLGGEIAAARGDYDQAISLLQEGVQLEDALKYDEPSTWHSPVRETLGAVLLLASKPAQAEEIYREDLQRYPENGFALFGLEASLRAQDKLQEANQVHERFVKAWQNADVQLTSSRF